jgi:fructose-1,6-bisphosphatase/inositol monophosphatase family enzyme
MDLGEDTRILVRAAYAARRALELAMGRSDFRDMVGMGADGTPTERMDRIAETAVLELLERTGAPWHVLSEERGYVSRQGPDLVLLDPVDGSHNAGRGLPVYSVSLAVGRDSLRGVSSGVVLDLLTGELWYAEKGRGAWKNGQRISVRPWQPGRELYLANLGTHSQGPVWARVRQARRVRALGSASLEIAYVAQGSADAYLCQNAPPERNLRVTDLAASFLLLHEAGGDLCDLQGRPFDLPLDLSTRHPVLAYGDARLRDHLLRPAGGTP